MRRFYPLLLVPFVLLIGPRAVQSAEPTADELAHFEEHIRPILVRSCYECHDGENAEFSANLRLDYGGGWHVGGDSGAVIDKQTPEKSLMLRAITYENPDLQMPPRSKLPDRDIKLLKAWILKGAPGPSEKPDKEASSQAIDIAARKAAHWAWQPVEDPQPPKVKQTDWPRDPLDRFILAKLEEAGLSPADEVDPAAWLRRVTFDLTGLPPTPEEVKQFVSNPDEAAREAVVDRLLNSRAFAECWAQHWLDLMRYAETKGHEADHTVPHAWRYRDYVIRALEANVPHNDFIVEHIAGDLLANPRIDPETKTNQSVQATGWWHMGEATHSPVDIRGEEADRIDNQIDVFGKTFLGMTVACARCHDHKFDAISTEDYYALCGFIQSSGYQEANVADPEAHERIVAALRSLNERARRVLINAASSHLQRAQLPKLKQAIVDFADGKTEGLAGQLQTALGDKAHPIHAVALAVKQTDASRRQAALAELVPLAGKEVPNDIGNVVIDFRHLATPPSADQWLTTGWVFGDRPVEVGEVQLTGDGKKPIAGIAESPAASSTTLTTKLTGVYRTPTFEVTSAGVWYLYRGTAEVFLDVDSHRTVVGPLHGVCRQKLASPGQWKWHRHNALDYIDHRVHVDFKPTGDFELMAVVVAEKQPWSLDSPPVKTLALDLLKRSSDSAEEIADATISSIRDSLDRIASQTATSDDARLVNWLLTLSDDFGAEFAAKAANYASERAALEKQIPAPQFALALLDGDSVDEYVHLRGSHKRLAPETTPRRFLAALDGQFDISKGSGRLELAHRVVAEDNPLTSRVHVNRVWAYLTGRGIVKSVDNFGVLGAPPTHPQLLDYLATEFVDSDWDTKALVRRIVLSSSYRQSTDVTDEAREVDPTNSLLHSARVRRIPAEAIRDSLFAVTGQLDPKPYGPSVRIHITDFMRHNRSPGWSGPMDGERRRSIYVEVRRNALSHFLTAFDRPAPFTAIGQRTVSNSPAQPLALLNDPLVHDLTTKWATRVVEQHPGDAAAIDDVYMTALARSPSAEEQQRVVDYLAAAGDRQQAWRDICLAIVNSKEFVFLR